LLEAKDFAMADRIREGLASLGVTLEDRKDGTPSGESSSALSVILRWIDALYFYRHSRVKDVEIFFSLRSIAAHAPWVRSYSKF
jgi:hypothetical protein